MEQLINGIIYAIRNFYSESDVPEKRYLSLDNVYIPVCSLLKMSFHKFTNNSFVFHYGINNFTQLRSFDRVFGKNTGGHGSRRRSPNNFFKTVLEPRNYYSFYRNYVLEIEGERLFYLSGIFYYIPKPSEGEIVYNYATIIEAFKNPVAILVVNKIAVANLQSGTKLKDSDLTLIISRDFTNTKIFKLFEKKYVSIIRDVYHIDVLITEKLASYCFVPQGDFAIDSIEQLEELLSQKKEIFNGTAKVPTKR